MPKIFTAAWINMPLSPRDAARLRMDPYEVCHDPDVALRHFVRGIERQRPEILKKLTGDFTTSIRKRLPWQAEGHYIFFRCDCTQDAGWIRQFCVNLSNQLHDTILMPFSWVGRSNETQRYDPPNIFLAHEF